MPRSRSRVTTVAALTAATVVSVVLIGILVTVALGGGGGGPRAAAPRSPHPAALPTGAPPHVSYAVRGTLYIRGRALRGRWAEVLSAGVNTAALEDAGNRQVRTLVFYGGEIVLDQIPSVSARQPVVLSPDGNKAAWVEKHGRTFTLVVYDLHNGRELGRRKVDPALVGHVGPETEGWENLQKIENDGTVAYGGLVVVHTWEPGSAVVDHDPERPGGYDPFPGFPADAGWVWVNAEGTWGAWETDRNGSTGNDRGDWTADAVTVQHPGVPATRFTFGMPVGATLSSVTWESETNLLAGITEDPAGEQVRFLRCNVVSRACERAPTPAER